MERQNNDKNKHKKLKKDAHLENNLNINDQPLFPLTSIPVNNPVPFMWPYLLGYAKEESRRERAQPTIRCETQMQNHPERDQETPQSGNQHAVPFTKGLLTKRQRRNDRAHMQTREHTWCRGAKSGKNARARPFTDAHR